MVGRQHQGAALPPEPRRLSRSLREVLPLKALPRPIFSRHESLAPGLVTPRHRHAWGQLSYALSGVLEVRTAGGGHVAPPMSAVWLPAGLEHEVLNRGRTEMRSLYVRADAAQGLPAQCTVLTVSPLARELILRVAQLPPDYEEAGPAGRLVTVLLDELAALAALAPAALDLPLPDDRRLQQLCAALQQQPDDGRSLADWGRQVGASERTLARLFRQQTGLGFAAWRQRLRLLQALPLLQSGQAVGRVALALGYTSVPAFVAAFKAQFGQPPGRWAGREAGVVQRGATAAI